MNQTPPKANDPARGGATKIAIVGTGYVGLVTAACLADSGNEVTCIDKLTKKIADLNAGQVPIYEPKLAELVHRNAAVGRLRFTADYAEAIGQAKCVYLTVGTPQSQNGSADTTYILEAAETIAPHLKDDAIVIVKSTVPIGTNQRLAYLLHEYTGRWFDVASNPEFLKEGTAVDDFTKPDRVVVGVRRPEVGEALHDLYRPFLRTDKRFLVMDPESAEMTKYAANALLATKISFINEIANLCEKVGADVNHVRRGIGHDQRIGFAFLFPGVGYGGSCFPKDVRALRHVGAVAGVSMDVLRAVDDVNSRQRSILFEKIHRHFGGKLDGRKIAVWGLAFKPRTDDVREAPALDIVGKLAQAGASVHAHDPVAIDRFHEHFRELHGDEPADRVCYFADASKALDDADALVILTEWNEYRSPNFEDMRRRMRSPAIFDGRNLYEPAKMAELGFWYEGIGVGRQAIRSTDNEGN